MIFESRYRSTIPFNFERLEHHHYHINTYNIYCYHSVIEVLTLDILTCFGNLPESNRAFYEFIIAILTVTSSIVINVPTGRLLAVETKDSFVLWLAKFKYQKICL